MVPYLRPWKYKIIIPKLNEENILHLSQYVDSKGSTSGDVAIASKNPDLKKVNMTKIAVSETKNFLKIF